MHYRINSWLILIFTEDALCTQNHNTPTELWNWQVRHTSQTMLHFFAHNGDNNVQSSNGTYLPDTFQWQSPFQSWEGPWGFLRWWERSSPLPPCETPGLSLQPGGLSKQGRLEVVPHVPVLYIYFLHTRIYMVPMVAQKHSQLIWGRP